MDPNISQILSEAKRDIWKRPVLNQQIFYTWYDLRWGDRLVKGGCQKRFSGFCPLRGYPPPYPLNGKSFCQKTLNGIGGYPPPLNGKKW